MGAYQEELAELRRQMGRKAHLEEKLAALWKEHRELEEQLKTLRDAAAKEQQDVDRLEGKSLSALLAIIAGNKVEKLTREKEEAAAAILRYNTAAAELEAVQAEIKTTDYDLRLLGSLQIKYDRLLKDKAAQLRKSGGPAGEELIDLEKKIARKEKVVAELKEAISAGRRAEGIAEQLEDTLYDARKWSTYDVVGGGSLTDFVKYDALDQATRQMRSLQIQLRSFRTELADVSLNGDISMEIDPLLRFSDFFFDDLFSNLSVLQKIKDAQAQVGQVRGKIHTLLNRLVTMEKETASEQERLQNRLEVLLTQAE